MIKTQQKYIEARGGRKTSVARARVFNKKSGITVNDKNYQDYFTIARHRLAVESPLVIANLKDKVGVSVRIRGGGTTGQAEAARQAIAAALAQYDPSLRKPLKKAGFLTRDPRSVERKKYGLKKARRAPQWQKR